MAIKLPDLTINKLDFIDRCRGRFSLEDAVILKLPQIIVVGDQSSGKSSILEALSGIKLPKGMNTVTKRPIVVQMRQSDIEKITITCDNKKYEDVKDVEAQLKEVQGDDITTEPCFVDVQSRTVPPLTVIDLPGIVAQRLEGQRPTIVQDVLNVATRYMEQENSLILCVIPSNSDFNNSNTIDIASKCDTNKIRTIGVLTKIDKLVNEEIAPIVKILKNISKPLKKGYYGLILPDYILSLQRHEREEKEIKMFQQKSELWDGCSKNLGMKNFTNKLVEELVALIDQRLPLLEETMKEFLKKTNKELDLFDNIHSSKQVQRKYLIEVKDSVLIKVEDALVKGVEKLYKYKNCAKLIKDSKEKHDTFLYGQHQIFSDLLNKFSRYYKESFTIPKCKYTVAVLQDLSKRCRTDHLDIFMSSEPFKEVVQLHLTKYEDDSKSCLDSCFELANCFIGDMIFDDCANKFPKLKEAFKERCFLKLEEQKMVALRHIQLIFKSESLCFTQKSQNSIKEEKEGGAGDRPPYVPEYQNIASINKIPSKVPSSQSMNFSGGASKDKDGDNVSLSSKEDSKINPGKILKDTLEEYIKNMYIRLADVIPSMIMLNLFKEFHDQLKESLNQYVTDEQVLEYFKLSESETKKISDLNTRRDQLQSSLSELSDLLKKSNPMNN